MKTVIKLATPDETIIAKDRIHRRGTAWIIHMESEFTRTKTFEFSEGFMVQYYLRHKTGKIIYMNKQTHNPNIVETKVFKEAHRLSTLGWDRIFYIQVPSSGRWTVSVQDGHGTVPISVQKESGLVSWTASVLT